MQPHDLDPNSFVGVAPLHTQGLQASQEQMANQINEAQLALEGGATPKRKGGSPNGADSPNRGRTPQQEGDNEERERKRQRRLLQNRQSAALSRQRKKEYLGNLERKAAELEAENKVLKQQIYGADQRTRDLEAKLAFIAKQNEDLKALLRTSDKSEDLTRLLQTLSNYSSLAIQPNMSVVGVVTLANDGRGIIQLDQSQGVKLEHTVVPAGSTFAVQGVDGSSPPASSSMGVTSSSNVIGVPMTTTTTATGSAHEVSVSSPHHGHNSHAAAAAAAAAGLNGNGKAVQAALIFHNQQHAAATQAGLSQGHVGVGVGGVGHGMHHGQVVQNAAGELVTLPIGEIGTMGVGVGVGVGVDGSERSLPS